MIDSGEAKNQSDLASRLGKNIIDNLKQLGEPMDKKVISERGLRKIIHQIDYPD